MDNRAIGVFDSGLGGLTVVKELKKRMPEESIVYLGDTGRVPYGTRSRETVLEYSRQDIAFLLARKVKLVIAACGTASSVITKEISGAFDFLYTGVVEPAAAAACQATKNGKIGVIGTSAAIRSGAYGRAMREIDPSVSVFGQAAPLFVPLVENGYIDPEDPVTRLVAEDYLKPLCAQGVDTLIMGCTHFPIIREIIARQMGPGVALIDPGQAAARRAQEILIKRQMCSDASDRQERFYVTDDPAGFGRIAGVFLGEEIDGRLEKTALPL